jgi:hypothetical protein
MRTTLPFGLILIAALWLAAPAPASCTGPACGTVALPYALDFSGDRGGLVDRDGVGTGFTIVDQPSHGTGYLPELLDLDAAAGTLSIETTPGIAYRNVNSLDNALGIGIAPRGSAFSLRTTLIDISPVHGGYAQAGLWFGASENDYVKLVVIATPSGVRVQMLREAAGTPKGYYDPVAISTHGAAVSLRLRVDPTGGSVTGAYAVNGGTARQIRTMSISPALLYRGQDGTEPVATGGVFATRRLRPGPLSYTFDDFEAACVTTPCTTAPPPPDPDFGDGDPPVGEPSEDGDPSDGDGTTVKPPSGSPGGAPAPTQNGDDGSSTAPKATLGLRRRVRLSALRRRGLRPALRCTADCTFSARLKLTGRSARRLRARGATNASLIVARARGAAEAGDATRFTVRPGKRTGRRLAATGVRTLRATLRVRVVLTPDTTQIIRRTVVVRTSAASVDR